MGEVTTIGLDLAKSVFQAHGADASGAGFPEEAATRPGAGVLLQSAAVRRGDGGLRQRPLLGPRDRRVGS